MSNMPPRLSHKKTRTGCKRCKVRKVKCDEEKPKCGACARHNVPCEYAPSPYDTNSPGSETVRHSEEQHSMELRLMHEWMAYTCMSLSTTWEFWKEEAPLIAIEFRYVMDAMLAVTALYASRQRPRVWSGVEGRMIELEDGTDSLDTTPNTDTSIDTGWKAATRARRAIAGLPIPKTMKHHIAATHGEMLEISRKYFASALEGHQKAVAALTPDNVRATFMSSILICYYSLFTLSEQIEDSLMLDPLRWFRVSRGTTLIIARWQEMVGDAWFNEAGGMYGDPDLSDDDELFRKEHQYGFEYLLDPVDGDTIQDEDREAYEHTLSYFGSMYKGIVHGTDTPLATGRRIVAMPARVPMHFESLVERMEPRATAMMAHVFALMKLAEGRFPWVKGIAQHQVPLLCNALPPVWLPAVEWPLLVVKGNVSAIPAQAL